MSSSGSAVDLLRVEIEQMKADGARRAELSLHACQRLFFDVGVRPTVANVREATATGSAGDIARDIEAFWQRLRQQGQCAVEGVPAPLQRRAGELVSGLYGAALAEARSTHAAELARAEAAAQHAMARQWELENEVDALRRQCAEQGARLASGSLDAQRDEALHSVLAQYAEGEKAALSAQLQAAQADNGVLREQVAALQAELASRAVEYAAHLKDALASAEARVRPLLVELDSLRQRVAAADRETREAPRREFEWMQQLNQARMLAAQARQEAEQARAEAERLRQAALASRTDTGGDGRRESVPPALGHLVANLIRQGVLSRETVRPLGRALDAYIDAGMPCPQCTSDETDLAMVGQQVEFTCAACGHQSGVHATRALALVHFVGCDTALVG